MAYLLHHQPSMFDEKKKFFFYTVNKFRCYHFFIIIAETKFIDYRSVQM